MLMQTFVQKPKVWFIPEIGYMYFFIFYCMKTLFFSNMIMLPLNSLTEVFLIYIFQTHSLKIAKLLLSSNTKNKGDNSDNSTAKNNIL